MAHLDSYDREIIRLLGMTRGEYVTNQIAEKTHMNWKTADRHLRRLWRLGFVGRTRDGRWWLRE